MTIGSFPNHRDRERIPEDSVDILNDEKTKLIFAKIEQTQKVENTAEVFEVIESWCEEAIIPSSVSHEFYNGNAMSTFLSKIVDAARQSLGDENNDPYHKLQRSPIYKKIYQQHPKRAKSLLLFACTQKRGSNAERLEYEVGRWSVHHFQKDVENYFFRQTSPAFSKKVTGNNYILVQGTGAQISGAQREAIYKQTLRRIGRFCLENSFWDYEKVKTDFEERLPETSNLTLQTYATLSTQLQVFCPEIFCYTQQLIDNSYENKKKNNNSLYFQGTVMRVLYEAIKIVNQSKNVTGNNEAEPSFQERLFEVMTLMRISKNHTPKTKTNKDLWDKITLMKEQNSPLQITNSLDLEEKKTIAWEQIRALARASGILPAQKDLLVETSLSLK